MNRWLTRSALALTVVAVASSSFAQSKGKTYSRPEDQEYLTQVYDALHGSPMQDKFKRIAPLPAGVVYVQRPGEGEKEMREHFRTMKKLGFNALKQIMTIPGWTIEQVSLIALEEGIIPFWYGEGGWAEITPELLAMLNIKTTATPTEIRNHPAMQKYQYQVLRDRILKIDAYKKANGGKWITERSVAFEPVLGGRGFDLSDEGKRQFAAWVKKTYVTIDKLNDTWNQNHFGLAPKEGEPFKDWNDFDGRWQRLSHNEYRHLRDILKFKVEHACESIQASMEAYHKFDNNHVFRAGGEMGLFLPHAHWGVDLSSIADVLAPYGSFYPSMHLAWHYDEVNHELTLPYYMQASMCADFFKGGWSAAWEATGGPQQFSGGKGGNGFTVDEGTMTQFILSKMAGGFKGFGLWCWSSRTAGWEAGEYALLDRHNQVTPRAIQVGKIAQAMQRYRDEMWQSRKEPAVGVLYDWDNDALWAAMSSSNRDSFKMAPVKARVGVSRALINANIPFEYVLSKDLRKGLAGRYKVIYLPSILGLSEDLLPILTDYVKAGGKLVVDMPSAWFNEKYALLNTAPGSAFERLFGATIADYQYSGINRTWSLKGKELYGFTIDLKPTAASVVERYSNGAPAITRNNLGKGTATILGYEASTACFKPTNMGWEQLLLDHTMQGTALPYEAKGSVVYRLGGPSADHYFVINDTDKPQTAAITSKRYSYKSWTDAITGESLTGGNITVPANTGRWVRAGK